MNLPAYPKYKKSGIEWLGDVPESWDVLPIKFVLSMPITDGPHETPEILSDGVPFLSAEAVKNDKLDFNRKRGFISKEDHNRFSMKYAPKRGDVYMVKSGATTGNVARVETDEVFNIWSPLAALRPMKERTFTDFIFFFMKSKPFFYSVELGWSYGTQQNIGMGIIENLNMALPPLYEQQKIADFLDWKTGQIDALIAKKKLLIEKLKEKRIALITHSVTKGLNPNAKMKDSGIPWLGEVPEHWITPVLRWYLRTSSGDFISNNDFECEIDLEHSIPVIGGNGIMGYTYEHNSKEDTLVIGRVGAHCGNVHLIKEKCWVTDNALIIDFDDSEFAPEYLFLLLISLRLNSYANKNAQPLITGETIKSRMVAIPPKTEQQKIADVLDQNTKQIDALITKNQQLIEKLTEYRTALLTAATTGKIDVRGVEIKEGAD